MENGRKFHFVILSVVVLSLSLCVQSASADTMYTYTGNDFNQFFNGGACPPDCNVTGWFIVAAPLAPNLPELTTITPLSFSLSSGGVTLTTGEPTDSGLDVATDASGAITEWAWVEVGPADSPDARILTESIPGSIEADNVRIGTNPPPFVGPRLAEIDNDPGTWVQSAVPEPNMIGLLVLGVAAVSLAVRRRNAV
jgi:hypothetical protein